MIERSARLTRRLGVLALVAGLSLLAYASPAAAQPYPGGTPPPTVGGQRFFPPGTARTGVDVLMLILLALLALILGLALRRLARRTGTSGS